MMMNALLNPNPDAANTARIPRIRHKGRTRNKAGNIALTARF